MKCKLHNLESKKAHLKYFRKLDLNREQGLIMRNIDIVDAIKICDMMLSVRSTVIYEAMYFKKPIFIMNPKNIDTICIDIAKKDWGIYIAIFGKILF